MTQSAPLMETIKLSEAERQLGHVVDRVFRHGIRVLVEQSGIPVAAIVSTADLRRLNGLEARRHEQVEAIREFSRAFADVPLDELERQVARANAEARALSRREREAALRE